MGLIEVCLQPAETMPKDETRFLGFIESPYRHATKTVEVYYSKALGEFIYDGWASGVELLPGWMPLPRLVDFPDEPKIKRQKPPVK